MSNPPNERPATLEDMARFWPDKSPEELAEATKAIAYAGGRMMVTGEPPQFVCPECRAASWHPGDRKYGYCARCHAWTGVPDPTADYPPGGDG